MSLIQEQKNVNGLKVHQAKIAVESQPFSATFGAKAQRKRPKIEFDSFDSLAGRTGDMHDQYLDRLEHAKLLSGTSGADAENGEVTTARESIFRQVIHKHSKHFLMFYSKGTSRRIWNELYKVIDSSDVILHVLDARDPEGTRCRAVEKYLLVYGIQSIALLLTLILSSKEAPHKHLIILLNKVDLVPSRVAVSIHLSSKDVICLLPH